MKVRTLLLLIRYHCFYRLLPAADPGPEHGLPHDQGGAGVGRGGGRYGASSPGEEEDDDYDDIPDSRQA